MQIVLNGQSRELADGSTVAELVELLELNPRHVAVEVNSQLVPRVEHARHVLASGDQLEVVTLVGGG